MRRLLAILVLCLLADPAEAGVLEFTNIGLRISGGLTELDADMITTNLKAWREATGRQVAAIQLGPISGSPEHAAALITALRAGFSSGEVTEVSGTASCNATCRFIVEQAHLPPDAPILPE